MSPNAPIITPTLESNPTSPTLSNFEPVQQSSMSSNPNSVKLPPCNCPQCVPGQPQFYYPQGFFQAAIPQPQPIEAAQGYYAPDGCWYPFQQQNITQPAFSYPITPSPPLVVSPLEHPSSPTTVGSATSSASPSTPQFAPIEQQQQSLPVGFGPVPPGFEPCFIPFPMMMGMPGVPMMPIMGPPPMQMPVFMPMHEVDEGMIPVSSGAPVGAPLQLTPVPVKQGLFFGEIPAAGMPVMMNA